MLPTKIYDLSQPVFNNCPQYPDTNPRPAQIRLFYMLAVQGVNKEIVTMSTHTGTHCDARFTFLMTVRRSTKFRLRRTSDRQRFSICVRSCPVLRSSAPTSRRSRIASSRVISYCSTPAAAAGVPTTKSF